MTNIKSINNVSQSVTLYVVDMFNHKVRCLQFTLTYDVSLTYTRVSISRVTVSSLAGSRSGYSDGLALYDGRFRFPRSVTVIGPSLIIADTGNQQLRLVTQLPTQSQQQPDQQSMDIESVTPSVVTIDTIDHISLTGNFKYANKQLIDGFTITIKCIIDHRLAVSASFYNETLIVCPIT